MTTRPETLDHPGARRKPTLPDVSLALCAGAMLLATLLTQPLAAGNSALAADTSPADASAGRSLVAKTIEQEAPDASERTVYRPEIFVPVTGNLSVPIEQQ